MRCSSDWMCLVTIAGESFRRFAACVKFFVSTTRAKARMLVSVSMPATFPCNPEKLLLPQVGFRPPYIYAIANMTGFDRWLGRGPRGQAIGPRTRESLMPRDTFPSRIRALEPFSDSFQAFRLRAEDCDVLFAT